MTKAPVRFSDEIISQARDFVSNRLMGFSDEVEVFDFRHWFPYTHDPSLLIDYLKNLLFSLGYVDFFIKFSNGYIFYKGTTKKRENCFTLDQLVIMEFLTDIQITNSLESSVRLLEKRMNHHAENVKINLHRYYKEGEWEKIQTITSYLRSLYKMRGWSDVIYDNRKHMYALIL